MGKYSFSVETRTLNLGCDLDKSVGHVAMMQEEWKLVSVEPCAKITFNILAGLHSIVVFRTQMAFTPQGTQLYHDKFLTL